MKAMRRLFTLMLLFMTAASFMYGQRNYAPFGIGFYNLENLFDTLHDEGKNDYEYLPDGGNHWSAMKYKHKLANMARVLAEMGTDVIPHGCAVIGISEVENSRCMSDLVSQEPLAARGFKYVHIEGPDKRGVDCAFIYNPQIFTPAKTWLQPYLHVDPQDDIDHPTRGFLTMQGTVAEDSVTFVVCHWPSRAAGSPLREQGGTLVRKMTDSIMASNPTMKIMVMGDMNDDPTNKSMKTCLGARREVKDVKDGDFWNPWWNTLINTGRGTLTYQGAWNLFDQIVLSRTLLNQKGDKDFSSLKYYKHHIFERPYLFQTEGKYKGNTKRTHAGGVWLDGYSDHLPVVTYLIKEVK